MNFDHSPESEKLQTEVRDFFENNILPRNRDWVSHVRDHGTLPDFLKELRKQARDKGLWNLGLPNLADDEPGTRLTNLEYAPLAEIMGSLGWASMAFNCQPPDVPNMMILQEYGTPMQKERWLNPLLEAETRSAFAMTEPDVASSDATNIQTSMVRDGDHYVINGRKWYSSGAANSGCSFLIVMGVTGSGEGRTGRHSAIIVPIDTPGVEVLRTNHVLGYDDPISSIGEIQLTDVRVPADFLLGPEGAGFALGQARLGPARVHHCMRFIGSCEVLISLMKARANERVTFGRPISEYDTVQNWIAQSRVDLDQARLLILKTAWLLDSHGHKSARREVSMIKVAVPRVYQDIADRAIQVFGAMGMSQDTPIASALANARALRLGDGPDEVHLRRIFRLESPPEYSIADSPYITPFDG